MWAQLITQRLRPGNEDGLQGVLDRLHATEQLGSGLLRSTAMRDQNNPSRVYMLVVFESEDAARRREQDTRRQEGLAEARKLMAEVFDGPPEFVDLTVLEDLTF
jgi:quinol monooxygenase YgiN